MMIIELSLVDIIMVIKLSLVRGCWGGHYYDQDHLALPIMERRIGRTIVRSLASFLEKVESHISTSSERA